MSAAKRKEQASPKSIPAGQKRIKTAADVAAATETGTAPKSLLSQQPAAFPRGGAGPLTLIEQKQIRAKASRDVKRELGGDLFNDNAAQPESDGEESDLDLAGINVNKTFAEKKTKKAKKSNKKGNEDRERVRIESVSRKKLVDGSLILGTIRTIGSRDLTVSLPNNLTGFVALTNISDQFSAKLEKLLASDAKSDSDEEEDAQIELDKHFEVGQFLRVAYRESLDSSRTTGEKRRHIDLSLEPSLCNAGLKRTSLAPGTIIQAAAKSIEDHGIIVYLGIEGAETGFIDERALPDGKNLSDIEIGSVLLCTVIGKVSDTRTPQLSASLSAMSNISTASSIDAFLPGTLAEILLTDVSLDGLAGKIIGSLDATADSLHSSASQLRDEYTAKYHIGQKIRGRIITNFPAAEKPRVGFSVLDNLTQLKSIRDATIELSSTHDKARVLSVEPGLGVYLSLPSSQTGFAHISRLADKTIEMISESSGPYRKDTEHKVRVLDFNAADNMYTLSLEPSVLDQPFLRVADISPGQIVRGVVEKILIGEHGVRGLLIQLVPGIKGIVQAVHLSDSTSKHQDTKFREGQQVKARVLSVDASSNRIQLTMKKALVNSHQSVWTSISDLKRGDTSIGTIIKIDQYGAIMQFFGDVKGRLPVSEMSEAYIKDAREHFKVGQVLNVNVLRVDAEEGKLMLTTKEVTDDVVDVIEVKFPTPGTFVTGTVFEKSADDLKLRLEDSDITARLTLDHIADGSEKRRRSAFDKIRVGQQLENILVLEVQRAGKLVTLCNKSSLRTAAEKGELLKSFEDLEEDKIVTGFVSNITEKRVFVQFANRISGVVNQSQLSNEQISEPDFGLKVLQPISARILSIDYRGHEPRFYLTMKTKAPKPEAPAQEEAKETEILARTVSDAIDEAVLHYSDLVVGRVVKVKITSVKETQLNVEIAKDILGRIDVSEVFDNLEAIHDRKRPLVQFSNKQLLQARIIGFHDSRTYKYLPLSHRSSKNMVFELTIRPSMISDASVKVLTYDDMKVGESRLAFVNNITDNAVLVNVSPAVRGRIRAKDVSDDMTMATNLARNFPVGSVMQARVTAVDVEKGFLDLSCKSDKQKKSISIDDISAGDIVTGRITKIKDDSVIVQLSEELVGLVELTDLADDYDQADPSSREKNEIVRAFVLQVDAPNKKVYLSLRPSKILSSGLNVKDPEIVLQNLEVGQIRRGFVHNVSEKGLHVRLARNLRAYVRIANISDDFLKDWKERYQRDQLVQGRIISVDKDSGHVQMSMKRSHIDKDYKPPLTITDLKEGDIVEGKIAKVETFGLFIVVDNSQNVRGLCHRSEIADKRIQDVTTLGFKEGDSVKAKVLLVDAKEKKINFGLKASYFTDGDMEEESDIEMEDDIGAIVRAEVDEVGSPEFDSEDSDDQDENTDVYIREAGKMTEGGSTASKPVNGLSIGSFDWNATPAAIVTSKHSLDSALEDETNSKTQSRKKQKTEPIIDKTGDLDVNGPQSADDFERLLLSDPGNAGLWIAYMAFYVDLGDIDTARIVGSKALSTINLAQEHEKMMIWVALLNLEVAYGDDETVDATLEKACETADPEEMLSRLASIYIQSNKYDKADNLFTTMLKRFTQNPKLWINYATFLFDQLEEPARARALLSRALQALPPFTHFDITSKFAQLEFKTKTGVPEEGRTRFQGLINLYPKRLDLFNVMIDLEIKLGDRDQVRAVFEQVLEQNIKPAKAKPFFARWIEFEKKQGNEGNVGEVEVKAANWVKQYGKKQEKS